MLDIKTMSEAEVALQKFVPVTRELLGKDLGLGRIRRLLNHFGNPQDNLKVIHIAGTSGKTSTTYYVAGLLVQAGQKVGHTVSPHIDTVRERIQVDCQPISEVDFCMALTEFLGGVEALNFLPSYFEVMIGFAYWYFAKAGVDYAVIETGLGGLHDASNVAGRQDKVCIITDIGLDHTNVLGNSLKEIAMQKAGIIYPNNHVLMYKQDDVVNDVVSRACEKVGAELDMSPGLKYVGSNLSFTDLPNFQQRNWLLAYEAYKYLVFRDSLPKLSHELLARSWAVVVPGRMQISIVNGKTIIMDGAHNPQKMQAFISSFVAKYPDQRPAVLLSVKAKKDFEQLVDLLVPIASQIILTSFHVGQDLAFESTDPSVLKDYCDQQGYTNVEVAKDTAEAYEKLLYQPADLCLVTGSFYLISQLRALESIA